MNMNLMNGITSNISNIPPPHYEAHENFIQPLEEVDCFYITHLESDLLCQFVTETDSCHELEAFVDYGRLLYCNLVTDGDQDYLVLAFEFLLLLSLIYVIALAAISYVIILPNFLIIANQLQLNEHSAAIFVLIWVNGLPDILSALRRHKSNMELLINQLLGTALYLRSFLCAIVYILYPTTVHKPFFLRDSIFHIFSTTSFASLNRDERSVVYDVIPCILVLLIYFTYAFFQDRYSKNKYTQYMIDKKTDIEAVKDYKIEKDSKLVRPFKLKEYNGDNNKALTFLQSINPLNKDIFEYSNRFQQTILILGAPFIIVCSLIVPVINSRLPQYGWSKARFCLNVAVGPLILLTLYDYEVWHMFVLIMFGIIISGLIFFLTSWERKPKGYVGFSVLAIILCIWISYRITSEILAIWTFIATVKGFSRQTVGIFFLTWGNSVQAIVINFTLASWGYPNMAFAAYYNTYLLNVIFVISLISIIKGLKANSVDIFLRKGPLGNSGIVFNILFEFIFLLAICSNNFQLRRSVGKLTITLYTIYLFHSFVVTVGILHGYGTDHSNDEHLNEDLVNWA